MPEISEIRGVDSGGVIATLLDRKLITTAGRKAVIGRPILYKTSKEFLLRFGLKDINELPSMEEFEKLLAESFQSDLLPSGGAPAWQEASIFATHPEAEMLPARRNSPGAAKIPNQPELELAATKKRNASRAPNRSSHASRTSAKNYRCCRNCIPPQSPKN